MAFEVYLHRLVTHVGAMVAAMQGLDALLFTGGELTSGDARVRTFVVHSRKDLQMIAEAGPLLA